MTSKHDISIIAKTKVFAFLNTKLMLFGVGITAEDVQQRQELRLYNHLHRAYFRNMKEMTFKTRSSGKIRNNTIHKIERISEIPVTSMASSYP